MKKKLLTIVVSLIALAVFIRSPLSNYPVSLAVMKIYSEIHARDSIMEEKGIKLHIPGGSAAKEKNWYPFVMTFNADAGFQRFTGESNLKLTILYNFPAFNLWKCCSMVYDSASPYGFLPDGSLDPEAAAQVPRFDFQKLVLQDFGIKTDTLVFDWKIEKIRTKVAYLGIDGWTQTDARLTVNGMQHQKEDFRRSYLQYGPPGYPLPDIPPEADFAPVDMIGRLYGRYFAEWDTSIFFYVLASNQEVLENCDRNILSRSILQ